MKGLESMMQSKLGQVACDVLLVSGAVASGVVILWDNHTEPIDVRQANGMFVKTTRAEMGTSIVSGAARLFYRALAFKTRLTATRDLLTGRSFG